jgi:hypothetical protein
MGIQYINCSQRNVEIGNEAMPFPFWEYMFQIFGELHNNQDKQAGICIYRCCRSRSRLDPDFVGSVVRTRAGKDNHKDIKIIKKCHVLMTWMFSLKGRRNLLKLGSSSWSLRRNVFSCFKFDLPYTV